MGLNFQDFLHQTNFLPLENGDWKLITVDHTNCNTKVVTSQIREYLKGYTNGIYVYTNLQNEVYYVGQGKLKGRVIKKYKQAISESIEIPSPRGLFFRSKKEVLNVYVRNVENYMEQIAIEAMLSNVLKPKYLDFLQEFNVYKKAGKLEELFNKLK
ncbi:hypothetical protein QFZ87_000780 [Bacillus sp. SLBN-46]|uniref:hypothetical protein n=1 Tax=Bacillus sp. SLBN-46 TaxID=3042283 RepID=UPI002865D027|nr:hypothetical protein [Bacillus sp. SLBN-46]MDR6121183.1 hypothetical protein [Bacillus sp. SLBN-46]